MIRPKTEFELIWQLMQAEKDRVNTEFNKLDADIDAAITTIEQAVADLPLAADGMNRYEVRFAVDGLKQGETTGNGTGVPVYYDSNSDAWLRFSDDSAVST